MVTQPMVTNKEDVVLVPMPLAPQNAFETRDAIRVDSFCWYYNIPPPMMIMRMVAFVKSMFKGTV